jgi:hypothetical protein
MSAICFLVHVPASEGDGSHNWRNGGQAYRHRVRGPSKSTLRAHSQGHMTCHLTKCIRPVVQLATLLSFLFSCVACRLRMPWGKLVAGLKQLCIACPASTTVPCWCPTAWHMCFGARAVGRAGQSRRMRADHLNQQPLVHATAGGLCRLQHQVRIITLRIARVTNFFHRMYILCSKRAPPARHPKRGRIR